MADILILVGTESGNAQMVAEIVAEDLQRMGHGAEVVDKGGWQELDLPHRETVLICCATHGDGELPDNIIPFADGLKADRPDLSAVRYGVIALGDSTHEQFCNAGRMMDALFAECGARRIGERLEIDACVQPLPDQEAVEWVKDWVKLL